MIIAKRNGIEISIEDWYPIRKKPVLSVKFDNDNCHYKVASFNDAETAKWFSEICEEFFKTGERNLGEKSRTEPERERSE